MFYRPTFRPKFESLESRRCLSINPVLLRDIGINVSDVDVDLNGSDVAEFYEYQGEVYFRANDGTIGSELYKTDGTSEGTVLVKDITQNDNFLNPSITSSSTPRGFREANGLLFFFADVNRGAQMRTELWRTDGTESGTVSVADVNLQPDWSTDVVGVIGDYLYFGIFDTEVDGTHNDLWRTDGTLEGTTLVYEFPAGTPERANGLNLWLTYELGDKLVFSAIDAEHGLELWKTDGTADGTQFLYDANPGEFDSYPLAPVEIDGELYFIADVVVESGGTVSYLHRTDGTAEGTERVSDALVDWQGGLFANDDLVYFIGYTAEQGFEPYRSDGTAAGTFQLADTWDGVDDRGFEGLVDGFFAALGRVFFISATSLQADGLYYRTLWSTQGTSESTVQLSENIVPPIEDIDLVEYHGYVYYSTVGSTTSSGNTSDDGLGRTDGTPGGTTLVVGPAPDWRNVSPKLVFDDKLILVGRVDGVFGQELWQFDSQTQSFEVLEFAHGSFSSIGSAHDTDPFHYKDMLLVYAAGSVTQGDELWSLQIDGPVIVAGDVDGDGAVAFSDFLILSSHYGMSGSRGDGDLNGDGTVDFADFLILANNFG